MASPARTLTQRILDKDYVSMKDAIEGVVAHKVVERINAKKAEIIKAQSEKPVVDEKPEEKKEEPKLEDKPVDEKKQ